MSLCYTIPALADILTPPPTQKISKITATRRRLADMDHLPMMHCNFNISSSALLHQSEPISRLVWSTQSKRSRRGGGGLVSSSHIYPPAKHKFHMLLNCSSSGAIRLPGQGRGRSSSTKPGWIITEGARAGNALTLGRENPRQDVWEGFLSFWSETNQHLHFADRFIC